MDRAEGGRPMHDFEVDLHDPGWIGRGGSKDDRYLRMWMMQL